MNRLLSWIIKLLRLIEFGLFYIKEVILSNLKVAYDVVTPSYFMKPALIEIDLTGMSDRQILAAANLITMTPGTLSLDLCEKTQRLKIHSMYVDNPDAEVRELNTKILRRIRNVF
jgi:multicomponent Na+:H+ antiporter subunit E